MQTLHWAEVIKRAECKGKAGYIAFSYKLWVITERIKLCLQVVGSLSLALETQWEA